MIKKMLSFLKPYRGPLSIVFLMTILSTVLTIMQPMIGRFIIDDVFLYRKYPFPLALGSAVLFMMFAYGVSILTKYIFLKTSLSILTDMKTSFYHHLLLLPYPFFSKKRVGDVISRVNEDLAEMQRLYTDSLLQFVGISLTFVLNVVFLLMLDWQMTIFCFILLPILIWGTQKFRDLLFNKNMKLRELSASNQSFLYDTFSSVRFIRAANLQKWLENKYKDDLTKLNVESLKVVFVGAFAQGIPHVILIISTIGTIWFLGLKVLNGAMSIGTLLAFTAYQASLYSSVQGFAQLYIRFQKGKASVLRVGEFFALPAEPDGSKDMPQFRQVRFDKVCFHYDGDKPIFHNFDFSFVKGEKIGIVGESGAGKSTLANLLARVNKPANGLISIDGIDIQNIKRDHWNRKVCLVAHDHPIWYGTVADFLRLGKRDISEQQMQTILEEVGLWKDIENLPGGLQTHVGEKGLQLSAGQRQRLLLASALLQDLDILILDEATCHLDIESERKIFELIRKRLKHKTVIIITHRLQNIMWVDRLLHLAEGSIRPYQQESGGQHYDSLTRLHG